MRRSALVVVGILALAAPALAGAPAKKAPKKAGQTQVVGDFSQPREAAAGKGEAAVVGEFSQPKGDSAVIGEFSQDGKKAPPARAKAKAAPPAQQPQVQQAQQAP